MRHKCIILLWSVVSLWVLSSCEDYDFKDIPDPIVPEDTTPGLKLSKDVLMIDAMGNAQGFELRAMGGKWSIEPEKETSWLLDYEPRSGEEGNSVVGITLRVNEGVNERFMKLIIRQENTGAVDTVLIGQYTYESSYTRKTDSLALIAVYNALSGDKWRQPWNFRKPITEWSGLVLGEVNGELRVVGLNFNDFQLSGNLVNEIGNLRELTSMKIMGGKVYGRVPNSLVNLRKLESLNVNFSDGAEWFLPDDMSTMLSLKEFKPSLLKISMPSFASLYTLPVLETLELRSIYILGDLPVGISKLKHLKSLSLAGTSLYRLPEDIGELETLTTLSLSGCGSLSSLEDNIGQLSNLTSLTLSGCKLLTNLPEGFGNLSGLTSLDLSNCEKLEHLSEDFGNLKIRNVSFAGCKALASLPESFGNLDQVTEINLSNCSALASLPESFGGLSALKKLTMTGTGMRAFPVGLSALVSLEELDITGPYGGEGGMSGVASDIFAKMTNLKKLNAGNNQFSGDLSWVKGMSKLEVLVMSKNRFSGDLNFDDFGSSLTEISFAENQLTGTLAGVSKLVGVKKLDLSGNQLSGELVAEIGSCVAMTNLNLRENNLIGSIPATITNLVNLSWNGLILADNRMSGEIPSAVLSWSKWNSLGVTWNVYPQQAGYGFTNVP